MKIAILGGGISGTALARMLAADGHRVVVLEKAERAGGLCKSRRYGEFTFDEAGGHIVFSKDKKVLDWQIDRWLASTEHTVRLMIAYWEQGFFPLALDKHSCNSYGGCGFSQLCESPNPESWIELNYEPRVWNPLAKGA